MTDNLNTLADCPFCGGKVVPVMVYHPTGYAFGCPKCRAKGPIYTANSADEVPKEAITAWNTRAHPQPTGDVGALVEDLNALADCDSRAGEPLGKCMRKAAATILALTAEVERLRAEWGERMAEHTRAIVRAAHAEEDVERVRHALVTAMIPIEAIMMSGADSAHCQDVRDALHDAITTGRAAIGKAET